MPGKVFDMSKYTTARQAQSKLGRAIADSELNRYMLDDSCLRTVQGQLQRAAWQTVAGQTAEELRRKFAEFEALKAATTPRTFVVELQNEPPTREALQAFDEDRRRAERVRRELEREREFRRRLRRATETGTVYRGPDGPSGGQGASGVAGTDNPDGDIEMDDAVLIAASADETGIQLFSDGSLRFHGRRIRLMPDGSYLAEPTELAGDDQPVTFNDNLPAGGWTNLVGRTQPAPAQSKPSKPAIIIEAPSTTERAKRRLLLD